MSLKGENDSDIMPALNRKAAILFAMGRHQEAKLLAYKGVTGYVEYFGEMNPTVVNMYTLLGDCCASVGEHDAARNAYKKALNIAENLYSPGAKQILELHQKIK